jgi:hypothetical protein
VLMLDGDHMAERCVVVALAQAAWVQVGQVQSAQAQLLQASAQWAH